jgi:hypothetical protein
MEAAMKAAATEMRAAAHMHAATHSAAEMSTTEMSAAASTTARGGGVRGKHGHRGRRQQGDDRFTQHHYSP